MLEKEPIPHFSWYEKVIFFGNGSQLIACVFHFSTMDVLGECDGEAVNWGSQPSQAGVQNPLEEGGSFLKSCASSAAALDIGSALVIFVSMSISRR